MTKEVSGRLDEAVNRKRMQGIMLEMGLEAIYPKPALSQNSQTHPVYPYMRRYYIHKNEERIYVFNGHFGLVFKVCRWVAVIDHPGNGILPGRSP